MTKESNTGLTPRPMPTGLNPEQLELIGWARETNELLAALVNTQERQQKQIAEMQQQIAALQSRS